MATCRIGISELTQQFGCYSVFPHRSTMSTSSQDPFPDLHQKMSKKIAQLTKVIYQLNTRNEDHQSEIDSITRSHQLETQRLMLDAASKIGKFKDLMDIRKVAVRSCTLSS